MGFLDKAKKMAEQAQAKLDDAQGKFNEQQRSHGAAQDGAPVVQYDANGRPINVADSTESVAAEAQTPSAAEAQPPTEPVAPAPAQPAAPTTQPPAAASPSDEHAPPTITSGDPLAG